jgi:1-acyl-sn-glycerol-3-phosphate acyltransferase
MPDIMSQSQSDHCSAWRTLWRCLRTIEHLSTGALILVWVSLVSRTNARPAWLPGVVRWWFGRLCRALGVRVAPAGGLAPRCLLVCNHISWLDVIVLGAQGQMSFLSKSEVRRWPLIGWMSAVVGTHFIERGANQVGAVAARISAAMTAGETLLIFPEGTTSEGAGVLPFHPRLFAIVQQPGLGIQPVALAYRSGDAPPPVRCIAFVDDQTLFANLWRLLRHPDLVAEVRFLEPLQVEPVDDRRRLARRARAAILATLGLPEQAGLDIQVRPRPRPRARLLEGRLAPEGE